jgi:hypothetical protein
MLDNKWHYTEEEEYPEVFGQYEKDSYPQIPCLVEDIGFFGIRYFNIKEQCWDDEEADDYFCSKGQIVRWRYLDALLNEK